MKLSKGYVFYSLGILTLVSVCVYLITRTILFLYTSYSGIEKFFGTLLMLGEGFVLFHSIGYTINILRVYKTQIKKTRLNTIPPLPEGRAPSVAILIAARHEPKEVLEDTFITLNNIDYPNKKVYFLDDSTDEKYKKEAEELEKEYGFTLFRPKTRHGAKAGIINDCLKTLTEEYLAVFDADQQPLPGFLNAVIPILENDKKLAFVQTPQFYTNIDTSKVARGAAFQQSVFYEYICEGKSSGGAMFCCGTNVIFRRLALQDVGGFDETTVTEDFATSLKLHKKGWKTLYFNHTHVFGMGPEDLGSYFKQQFRWSTGTIGVFKKLLITLFTRPFSLRPFQWWEYILSSTYYLVGIAYFILIICPVMYLLFKVPSFFARPEIYFLTYVPYIVLGINIFYVALSMRNYRKKDLFLGQLLGFASFPVYIKGALSALLGIRTSFGITGKIKGSSIPFLRLWPQWGLFLVCFISLVWGLNRFAYERDIAVAVNCFWTFYHCILLTSICYFNKVSQ